MTCPGSYRGRGAANGLIFAGESDKCGGVVMGGAGRAVVLQRDRGWPELQLKFTRANPNRNRNRA